MSLSNTPLPLIFIVSLVLILGISELGHQVGRRMGTKEHGDISVMESSALGLLALMIGFTFAMSLARFEARRDAILEEANTIGTAALRARLLPAPHNRETLDLLREYAEIRVDIAQRVLPLAELNAAIEHSNNVQEQLWQQARAVAAKDTGMVPTGLFIQSLNDMFDAQGKRIAAGVNRVPVIVLWVLYGIAGVSIGFTGYRDGLADDRSRVPRYVMGIVVAGVILLIQDLDRPTAGFIQVSQRPIQDTAKSLEGYRD